MKKCIINIPKDKVTLEVTNQEEGWKGKLYKTYQRNEISNKDLKDAKERGYKIIFIDPFFERYD